MRCLNLAILVGCAAAVMFAGCYKETKPAAPAASTSTATSSSTSPAGQTTEGDDEKAIQTALAELSAEDRELAVAQRYCPVGGGRLGSMDKPPSYDVKGRKVFLCCDGCKDRLLDDPDTYLAKLDSAAAKTKSN